ncbi:hypothetical protein JTB14_026686 [Gonioctena quinquepunctata]|nr:hypothetical protein JTB14_026686 [Gonioctena quinquepunctata]
MRPKGYTREINVNDFVAHLQRSKESCIYESILKIQYNDFAVDEEYKNILRKKVEQFRDNMANFLNGQLVFNNLVILRETTQGSEKWKIMRSNFFTSSLTKRISSLVSDSAKTNFIRGHLWGLSKNFQSSAMKYGIEMESVARTSYNLRILDEDEEIQQIGLVVNKNYPFLASSVDGIVLKNGKINRIIEIKCPKLLAGQDPHNFENVLTNSQKNNFFLSKTNGEFHLKKNHPYLYQVVTSMLIFEVEHCDL